MLIRFRSKAVAIFHCNGYGGLLSSYNFGYQHLYSSTATPAPTNLLAKYLVDSLGFSNEEAASASSKVTSPKTLKSPESVINFLNQNGFDNTQMKKMVSRVPKLLFRNVSKTLKPKFQFLMDLGFSRSDLVDVIVKDTKFVDRGLDTHMRPTIDCLRRVLGSDENVVKALKGAPLLLTFGAYRTTETNLMLLKNRGVPDDRIESFVLRFPGYFTQNPERMKDLLHRLENDLRITLHSRMFPYAFHALAALTKSKLENKIGIFKIFGWSDDDVLMMFRRLPGCISLSEDRIQEALSFYMKKHGCAPAYLASHPSLLVFNLGKRVIPRIEVLKILDERKLERRKLALYTALRLTETKFIDYFVLPYKDQVPDLYEQLKKIVAP